MSEIDSFIETYCQALRDENAAVFAGAGLSIPTGLVDWATLLRGIAADLRLSVDREHDLLSVAQFHVNERGRHRINQTLVTEFAERSKLTENHRILASLPIRTFWTTNYDTLIEDSLRQARKRVDVKTTEPSLAVTLPRRDAVVYKMHGDVSQVDQAVITRDDYEAYATTHPLFGSALQGDMVSKTFLFIGFSFTDPNLAYVLSRIRLLLGQNRRDHYCLLRRVQPGDFADQAQYDYARGRQDLQVDDLRRYGIQGLMVDSYAEYTATLRRLSARFRRKRVFVAGSAATYGDWTDADAQHLLSRLGAGLIRQELDIVTGFGPGVGPLLLNGALDGLAQEGTQSLHDRVTLRPFPFAMIDPGERAARWTAYRQEMIATTGIAVFVFGNRRNAQGEVEDAAGVMEEFRLAEKDGLVLVPIGATGYVAQKLHADVMQRYDALFASHPEWRSQLESLGADADRASLADRAVALIDTIARTA